MKQIYNFERINPPALNENMLHAELEKRRLQKQITILIIGSVLMACCVLFLAQKVYCFLPAVSTICVLYVCVMTVGSILIVYVFSKRREVQ